MLLLARVCSPLLCFPSVADARTQVSRGAAALLASAHSRAPTRSHLCVLEAAAVASTAVVVAPMEDMMGVLAGATEEVVVVVIASERVTTALAMEVVATGWEVVTVVVRAAEAPTVVATAGPSCRREATRGLAATAVQMAAARVVVA